MDINEILVSDEELSVINNGAWVEPDGAPGVKFFVTGLQSAQARKLMQNKQSIQRGKNRGKALTNEQLARCTKEVLAESVLRDWSGLKDGGEEIEFSADLAKKWMLSPNGDRFTEMVLSCADQLDSDAKGFIEEVSKNLQPA